MTLQPYISVCIATYNRAELLQRAVESVQSQDFSDWEIIIVDDGSKDDTPLIAMKWADQDKGRIRYVRQSNMGRPHALNRAMREVRGRLFTFLDDDDVFLPGAFSRIQAAWGEISELQREQEFCGLVGLCTNLDGALIGDKFPQSPWDRNYFDARFVHRIRGDKKEVVRADLIQDFSFVPEPGERRVPTSLLWHTLAAKYKMRFMNDYWVAKDYQPGGMTDKNLSIRIKSAATTAKYYEELLQLFPNAPLQARLKLMINSMRFRMHRGISPLRIMVSNAPLNFMSIIPAMIIWAYDSIKMRR